MTSSIPDPTIPAIIGASIGGMIVSHALCEAGVPHLLIGEPPGAGLRPGESLDLPASVAMPALFPHLRQYFHHKGGVIGVFDRQRVDLIFQMPEHRSLQTLVELMGFPLPAALCQVDRIGFDAALHAELSEHPACTRVLGRVAHVEYEPESDRVTSLRLDDGRRLQPRYVFDGSGPARLVGRAAELTLEPLSAPHRAIIAHYPRPRGLDQWWSPHTTLLRLYASIHGVDGGVWCIPMNDVISIGVSASASTIDTIEDQALLTIGLDALRRVGVELAALDATDHDGLPGPESPEPVRQLSARYQYSKFARGFGQNYLLVGSAGMSAWWLSSSGLGMILAAAAIAADLVRGRRRVLRRYQTYADQVHSVHQMFEELMGGDEIPSSGEALRPIYEPLMRGNLVRLAMYCHLARRSLSAEVVAPLVRDLVGRWKLGDVRGIERVVDPQQPASGVRRSKMAT